MSYATLEHPPQAQAVNLNTFVPPMIGIVSREEFRRLDLTVFSPIFSRRAETRLRAYLRTATKANQTRRHTTHGDQRGGRRR